MNRILASTLLAALLPFADLSAAHAGECLPQVEQAWIRLPPNPAMPMTAGFARIRNPCRQTLSVVGADSLAFDEVSLHESREVDGVNRMREIEALPIPAGTSVELKPGGLHLMLYRPESPLKEGDRPVITLKLQDGRSVPAIFEVRRLKP